MNGLGRAWRQVRAILGRGADPTAARGADPTAARRGPAGDDECSRAPTSSPDVGAPSSGPSAGKASAQTTPDVGRALERILDDERLRGSLEDGGYAPIIALASDFAERRAATFASTDDLAQAIRNLVVAIVAAAEGGSWERLRDIDARLIDAPARAPDRDSRGDAPGLGTLGTDPNANARAVVDALSRGEGGPGRDKGGGRA